MAVWSWYLVCGRGRHSGHAFSPALHMLTLCCKRLFVVKVSPLFAVTTNPYSCDTPHILSVILTIKSSGTLVFKTVNTNVFMGMRAESHHKWRCKMMKKGFMLILGLTLAGCGGSSSDPVEQSSVLQGTWVSHCHALIDDSDGTFMAYVIDTYTFDKTELQMNSLYYNEQSCSTTSGEKDNYLGDYRIGESVTATDGESATRLAMTVSSPEWPAHIEPVNIEKTFRIMGSELNFGTDSLSDGAEMRYDITFTKQ